MSLRTTQVIVPAGTAPTFTAATASDTMDVNDGNSIFAVYRSTHSATITVTAVTPGTLATGDAYPDKVYTIPVGSVTMQEVWVPILKEYFDSTSGLATVTCSPVTAVTMA